MKTVAVAAVLALALAGAVVWHRRRSKRRTMTDGQGGTRPLARASGPAGVPAPRLKRPAPEGRKADTSARRAAVLTMA